MRLTTTCLWRLILRFSSLQLKTQIILVLVTAAMTASCIRGPSKPESQVEGSETAASFKPEEMTGESISQENDSVWKFKRFFYLYQIQLLEACWLKKPFKDFDETLGLDEYQTDN